MKKSVYEIVTDKIISGLGKGQIPWKKKWVGQGLPMNYFSKRHYQGINMLLLALNDFESPYYLTFNQVNKLGGKVIKGSESEMVVFWKVYKKTQRVEDPETGETNIKADKKFVLRYYRVFNAEQIEGVEFPKLKRFDHSAIDKAEEIWQGYTGRPKLKKGRPSYNPSNDVIKIPGRERFKTAEDYYKTLFHEAIHSTGHRSRLDRPMEGINDKSSYSFEELIAEIGASFLVNQAGIQWDETNSQAYINGWISFLKEQNANTIISAASKAKKASQYILRGENGERARRDEAKESLQTA